MDDEIRSPKYSEAARQLTRSYTVLFVSTIKADMKISECDQIIKDKPFDEGQKIIEQKAMDSLDNFLLALTHLTYYWSSAMFTHQADQALTSILGKDRKQLALSMLDKAKMVIEQLDYDDQQIPLGYGLWDEDRCKDAPKEEENNK